MIIITKRDIAFLSALNETGACNSKFPLKFYKKRFSRNRLEHMEKEKIINRKYNLITLGIEGKIYLESIDIVPKIVNTMPIATQRRLARALELKQLLVNFKVVTSAVYKKKNNLNRGMLFVAAATTKNGINYLIYDIPKVLSVEAKTQILRELKNKKGVIKNVILLTRNRTFLQLLFATDIPVCELLITTPSDISISLLNTMSEGGFDRKVIGASFPEIKDNNIFNVKGNKYIVGNNTYINFTLNNVSAINILRSFNNLAITNNVTSLQTYYIVCLDIQICYLKYIIEEQHIKNLNIQFKVIAAGQCYFY